MSAAILGASGPGRRAIFFGSGEKNAPPEWWRVALCFFALPCAPAAWGARPTWRGPPREPGGASAPGHQGGGRQGLGQGVAQVEQAL